MEQNILYSMGKEGASNLVSLLSESLEPVVDMHNNDCVICSCAASLYLWELSVYRRTRQGGGGGGYIHVCR